MRDADAGMLRVVANAATATMILSATLTAQSEPFRGLDAYVGKAVADWKVPGLSIAIVRNDSVIFAKGYGVLAVGSPAPVNEHTLFEIGSDTKAFTATLVAMLATDGKMRFDDKLSVLLPDFRMADPLANAEVTARDALSHRSGASRGDLAWIGAGISRADVVHRIRFLKVESPLRSRWSYNNMMFVAVGEAAARAAGTTWENAIKTRVFTPLGMAESVPGAYELTSKANVATPHRVDGDSTLRLPFMTTQHIAPAGAILSSAHDMAQWIRFQLGDGMFAGKRIVGAAQLRQTHTPQIVVPISGGVPSDTSRPTTVFSTYGMGWMVQDYRRALEWTHDGNTEGSTASVALLPEYRFGVVVLSNTYGSELPSVLARYVMDRQLGAPVRDLSAEALARAQRDRRTADSTAKAQESQRAANAQPPFPLPLYVGTFVDSLYGEAVVSLADGRLQLRRGDWSGSLEYWNGNTFRWKITGGSIIGLPFIKFDASPDKRVTGMFFGLGDINLMVRKATASGGGSRGGR